MSKEVEILRASIKGMATHARSQIDILEATGMGRVGKVFKYMADQLEESLEEADKVREGKEKVK